MNWVSFMASIERQIYLFKDHSMIVRIQEKGR